MKTKVAAFIIGLLLSTPALACESHGHKRNLDNMSISSGTGTWTDFVVHVREGNIEGAVVGRKCKGKAKDGKTRTVGCARRRASPPGALLDGECWITVPKWDVDNLFTTLYVWGHELAHCVRGTWHS